MARIDFDQLDDFDMTGIVDGQLLRYNAVTENMEPYTSPTTFGEFYERDIELGNTSTSSTTWKLHHTFTTQTLPPGTYRITWGFTWKNKADRDKNYLEVRVRANGTDLYDVNFRENNKNKDNKYRGKSYCSANFVVGVAGTVVITIEMRRNNESNTVQIYDSFIENFRIS